MKTITISNLKGGVAKTTTAVTIAQGLANLYGFKVLIVDTDAQGQVAPLLGLEKADALFQLLVAERPLWDKLCITYANSAHNIAVVRSNTKTAKAKNVLATPPPAPIDTFARHLQPAADVVHYCVVDTAPGLDNLLIQTLWAADYVVIPVTMERLALQGLVEITQTIKQVRDHYGANTQLLGVLPTQFRRSTNEHRRQLTRLSRAYSDRGYGHLIWPAIPQATAITEASAAAVPLWEHDPNGKATARYKLALELIINGTQT